MPSPAQAMQALAWETQKMRGENIQLKSHGQNDAVLEKYQDYRYGRTRWTAEEGAAVLELRRGYQLSFADIARKLYPRSEEDLTFWYKSDDASDKAGTNWEDYEDVLLLKLRKNNENWKDIATQLKRSEGACKKRWHLRLSPLAGH